MFKHTGGYPVLVVRSINHILIEFIPSAVDPIDDHLLIFNNLINIKIILRKRLINKIYI